MKWVALGIAATFAAIPRTADACGGGNYCGEGEPLPDFIGLRDVAVPADAALVIEHGVGSDVEAWSLGVVVRDGGGVAVPGRLQHRPGFSEIFWRPDTPWTSGARVRVDLSIELEPAAGIYPQCGPLAVSIDVDIVEPLGDRPAPRVDVIETVRVRTEDVLEARVCCDGALPVRSEFPGPGYGCTNEVQINHVDGACVIGRGQRMLDVQYRVGESPGIDVDDYLVRLVPDDGPDSIGGSGSSVTARLASPMCGRLEVLELGVGVVHSAEVCHGADLAEPLGPADLDVADDLAEQCAGEPYVCEVTDEAWDARRCRAWGAGPDSPHLPAPMPPGATPPFADGAGCSITPMDVDRSPGLLPLLLVLHRRPRRRP